MFIPTITQKLLALKKEKGLTFADLEKILSRDEVWIASVIYRQASASQEEAELLVETLGLDRDDAQGLTEYPVKGCGPVVPTDPLIYRFYEIMQVYGMPLKAVDTSENLQTAPCLALGRVSMKPVPDVRIRV